MPEVFRAVISLSEDNLPMAIRIDIKSAIGMVNNIKEGNKKIKILAIEKKLTSLLINKSMICRIFPISKTKVRTNKIITKGNAISLKIYRSMILRI
jgi:hypothetical protein